MHTYIVDTLSDIGVLMLFLLAVGALIAIDSALQDRIGPL